MLDVARFNQREKIKTKGQIKENKVSVQLPVLMSRGQVEVLGLHGLQVSPSTSVLRHFLLPELHEMRHAGHEVQLPGDHEGQVVQPTRNVKKLTPKGCSSNNEKGDGRELHSSVSPSLYLCGQLKEGISNYSLSV